MDFVLNLEYSPHVPLYRRLSDALRKAILQGRLKPGDAMPSVRDLVSTLSVSRATVLKAFEDLHKQGYLETSHGRGTFIRQRLPGDLFQLTPVKMASREPVGDKRNVSYSLFARCLLESNQAGAISTVHLPEINFGGPPINMAPIARWKQLLLKYCRLSDLEAVAYATHPFGYPPLQEALAAYLHRTRAVKCQADQVAIFSSKQLRLDLLCRILIDRSDCVAFEEPGYPEARQTLLAHGANIVPIPVDEHGMDVSYLKAHPSRFKLIYVTPSHQDPTGAVLSMERRQELLSFASDSGALILEDDYDSEYRYGSKPLPSLQRLDGADCVIYLSSPWKILFQVSRMGYIVVPQRLKSTMMLAKMSVERHMPLVEQFALTDFINGGHLELHIKRTHSVYARARQALIYALTRHFGCRLHMAPESAGMHTLIKIDAKASSSQIEQAALSAGIPLMSTKAYYVNESTENEFILPFAQIDKNTIGDRVEEWAAQLNIRNTD